MIGPVAVFPILHCSSQDLDVLANCPNLAGELEKVTEAVAELIRMNRRFANAFIASGYKPKQDSDNPGEALLFDALSLLANVGDVP